MPSTTKSPSSTTGKPSRGFTDDERAAMRQRAREAKAEANKADGESDVLASISEMQPADRVIAERLHAIASTCGLSAKTWYGMPAWAKNGNMICYFQTRLKFKTRYTTLGFSDKAHLDDGTMWPNSYALTELTPAIEARIVELVKKAVS